MIAVKIVMCISLLLFGVSSIACCYAEKERDYLLSGVLIAISITTLIFTTCATLFLT